MDDGCGTRGMIHAPPPRPWEWAIGNGESWEWGMMERGEAAVEKRGGVRWGEVFLPDSPFPIADSRSPDHPAQFCFPPHSNGPAPSPPRFTFSGNRSSSSRTGTRRFRRARRGQRQVEGSAQVGRWGWPGEAVAIHHADCKTLGKKIVPGPVAHSQDVAIQAVTKNQLFGTERALVPARPTLATYSRATGLATNRSRRINTDASHR